MCDTLVALGSATRDGTVLLAKNSDREPNEAHQILRVPRMQHAADTLVTCTHQSIPQVAQTNAVLLGKPFQMWGCEIGLNEHGVAIGNEAVFTREPYARTGLTGMDLMRLALERAHSAERALEIITELIAEYGQGGACGYLHQGFYYHNAYILADRSSAWVLETAGKCWAAEKVCDVRSISNRLTIGETWDLASPGLVEHAQERGWLRRGQTFDFARCYSDRIYTHFSRARERQQCTTAGLTSQQPKLDVSAMISNLRHHGDRPNDASFVPATSSMRSVCMHAGNELLRSSQSVGSMVAQLGPVSDTLWMTGTSAPCTGVFKPLYLDGQTLPDMGPALTGQYDPASMWWQHERLHRALLQDYGHIAPYAAERDAMEQRLIVDAAALEASGQATETARADLSRRAFDQAAQLGQPWTERILAQPPARKRHLIYDQYWRKQAHLAGFPID